MTHLKRFFAPLALAIASLCACAAPPDEATSSASNAIDVGTYTLNPVDANGILTGTVDVQLTSANTSVAVWLMIGGQWVDAVVGQRVAGASSGMQRLEFAFQIDEDYLDGEHEAEIYVTDEPLPTLEGIGTTPTPAPSGPTPDGTGDYAKTCRLAALPSQMLPPARSNPRSCTVTCATGEVALVPTRWNSHGAIGDYAWFVRSGASVTFYIWGVYAKQGATFTARCDN